MSANSAQICLTASWLMPWLSWSSSFRLNCCTLCSSHGSDLECASLALPARTNAASLSVKSYPGKSVRGRRELPYFQSIKTNERTARKKKQVKVIIIIKVL